MNNWLLHFTFLIFFIVGCSKNVEEPPCTLSPITPTPRYPDFDQFTLLGPKVNGEIKKVVIHDAYAFIEVGDTLVILNIHDPSRPKQLGSFFGGKVPFKVKGDYAYAYWDDEMHILDLSNPSNPVEVGCLEENDLNLTGAEFSDNYAYLPYGKEGLRIYDVTHFTSPVEVASYQSNTSPDLWWHKSPGEWLPKPIYRSPEPMLSLDVAVSGKYAYVGEGQVGIDSLFGGKLSVVDVSNPHRPKRVSTYTMPQNTAAMRVILDGDYVYVSTFSMYEAQLTIVLDISNPKHPVEVASFPTGALKAVHNGFAYFNDYEVGLVVWNVSNPTSPKRVGTIELPLFFPPRYAMPAVIIDDIKFDDKYAYIVIEYGGLYIFDISDPTNAKEVSLIEYEILPEGRFLTISNEAAYLGSLGGNITVLDISKPNSLPILGHIVGLGAKDLTVIDNIAYVARGENGFSIVDISDLEAISILNSYDLDDFQADRIVLQDELLFILEEEIGLHIFDISDHSNIILLSTFNLDLTSYDDIAIWDEYAFVAMGQNEGEINVIDISEPTRPRLKTRINYPIYFTSIAANEYYIYIVTSWELITIFDMQNPEEPIQISVHDTEYFINDTFMENDVLYLALNRNRGIATVEFKTP